MNSLFSHSSWLLEFSTVNLKPFIFWLPGKLVFLRLDSEPNKYLFDATNDSVPHYSANAPGLFRDDAVYSVIFL